MFLQRNIMLDQTKENLNEKCWKSCYRPPLLSFLNLLQGRIQDFKLGGGALKIVGVFRVKNHDFTPKNHIFPILGGGARNLWDISCEKSRFYAKKIIYFPILGGARAGCAPP